MYKRQVKCAQCECAARITEVFNKHSKGKNGMLQLELALNPNCNGDDVSLSPAISILLRMRIAYRHDIVPSYSYAQTAAPLLLHQTSNSSQQIKMYKPELYYTRPV